MLLLAIDTSGKHGSIALAQAHKNDADREGVRLIESMTLQSGSFSAQLIPNLAALLSRHAFTKRDIDGFAVISGPGSFTGLRVGLSAVKALADVLGKPIAAVSLLHACAFASECRGKVVAALDAGRGDVYVGEYDAPETVNGSFRESIMTRNEFLVSSRGANVVTPDSTIAELLYAAEVQVTTLEPVSAGTVAELGWKKIQSGTIVSAEALDANYIRRTDAEMLERSKF